MTTTPEVKIRRARPWERDDLTALQRRSSFASEGFPPELLAQPEIIQVPAGPIGRGHVFVAVKDGTNTGFVSLEQHTDGNVELEGLFIDPPFQRQGIGRMLVQYACRFTLREFGASRLCLIANPAARDFYLKAGFVETGKVNLTFGTGVTMEKLL